MSTQSSMISPSGTTRKQKQGAWSTKSLSVPDGPSILIAKPVSPQHSFDRKSPFALKRTLDKMVGSLLQAVPISGGSLLIEVKHRAQAEILLQLNMLQNIPVQVELSTRLNQTSGKVYSRDLLCLTEEELLSELEEQGVCGVVRIPQGRDHSQPSPILRLFFTGRDLPQYIKAGYLRIRVEEWKFPPKRCDWCQRYGHLTKHCRRHDPICGFCTESHPTDSCAQEGIPKCAGCHGPHRANSKKCIKRQEAEQKQGLKGSQSSKDPSKGIATGDGYQTWPSLPKSTPAERTSLPPPRGTPPVSPGHPKRAPDQRPPIPSPPSSPPVTPGRPKSTPAAKPSLAPLESSPVTPEDSDLPPSDLAPMPSRLSSPELPFNCGLNGGPKAHTDEREAVAESTPISTPVGSSPCPSHEEYPSPQAETPKQDHEDQPQNSCSVESPIAESPERDRKKARQTSGSELSPPLSAASGSPPSSSDHTYSTPTTAKKVPAQRIRGRRLTRHTTYRFK